MTKTTWMMKTRKSKINMFDTYIILIILGILNLITLGCVIVLFKKMRRMTSGRTVENLEEIIFEIVDETKQQKSKNSSYEKALQRLDDRIAENISRARLIRYNPFGESGGNHSFSLGLLNNNSDGIVLTGLYGRDRTNLFAKEIKAGKCEQELSLEEQQTISIRKT